MKSSIDTPGEAVRLPRTNPPGSSETPLFLFGSSSSIQLPTLSQSVPAGPLPFGAFGMGRGRVGGISLRPFASVFGGGSGGGTPVVTSFFYHCRVLHSLLFLIPC